LRADEARSLPPDSGGRRSRANVTAVRASVALALFHVAGYPIGVPRSALQRGGQAHARCGLSQRTFEYERKCRRYSVERFTSLHRRDVLYIF